MNKKLLASLFAVGLAAGCVCSSVDAHGVFFANRLDEKALVLGEGPVDDAYSPEMVKGIVGLDNNGMVIPLQVIKHEKNVAIIIMQIVITLIALCSVYVVNYFVAGVENNIFILIVFILFIIECFALYFPIRKHEKILVSHIVKGGDN